MKRNLLSAICLAFLFCSAETNAQETPYWTIGELFTVERGAKGYGYSTFRGSEPEQFQADILASVYADQGFLVVLAELRGSEFERAGNAIAGTSGSPVYLDEKLVGALAYGWPFQRVPLMGIVPFEYMKRENAERGGKGSGIPPVISVLYRGPVVLPLIPPKFSVEDHSLNVTVRGNDTFSWIEFKDSYASGETGKLKRGSAMSVGLIVGDKNYVVTGTITARDGDTIYAFGHPIFRDGTVQYPGWQTSIATVMPSLEVSFKFVAARGRGERALIEYDGMFGIYGTVGKEPEMIPVTLSFSRGDETVEVKSRIVYGRDIPDLAKILALKFVKEYPEFFGNSTIRVEGRIKAKALPEVFTENLYTAGFYTKRDPILQQFIEGSPYFDALDALLREDNALRFESLRLDFRVVAPNQKLFVVEDVFPSEESPKPGEKFLFSVVVAEQNGISSPGGRKRYVASLNVEIPRDVSQGTIVVLIEGGERFTDKRFRSRQLPTTIEEVVENLNRTPRNDRLYVSMLFPRDEKEEKQAETKPISKETDFQVTPGFRSEILPDWKELAESPSVIWEEDDPVAVIELPFLPGFNGVIEGGIGFQIEVKPKRSFFN